MGSRGGYAQQADYAKAFDEAAQDTPRRLPLGEAPVLLGRAEGKKRDDGSQILSLHPLRGTGIDISLDTRLLHIFTRLLREQVATTGWDVNLALHAVTSAVVATPETVRRLN
jgi:hypothetical protein